MGTTLAMSDNQYRVIVASLVCLVLYGLIQTVAETSRAYSTDQAKVQVEQSKACSAQGGVIQYEVVNKDAVSRGYSPIMGYTCQIVSLVLPSAGIRLDPNSSAFTGAGPGTLPNSFHPNAGLKSGTGAGKP